MPNTTISRPALETQQLGVGYRTPLVPPLDLRLAAGEMVCLVGPNGAGKSTLLRTLAGVQKPLSGRVQVTGADIHRLTPAERACHLSIVLTTRPDAPLLNGYRLVSLGRYPHTDWSGRLSAADEAAVEQAVRQVGAENYAARPLATLSDGQQQKLMIARALAQGAPVMLLDEPTAFLDLPRRVEILHLLRRLTRENGCAVLLSTHDLDLALRISDRIWLMGNGEMTAGAPEDLVLSGAFERAFQADGVLFDSSSGAFRLANDDARPIRVSGDGDEKLWTLRALERAGYVAHDHAPAHIVLRRDHARVWWQLKHGTQQQEYPTLEALINRLREHDLEYDATHDR